MGLVPDFHGIARAYEAPGTCPYLYSLQLGNRE
jgi:hypothetical protein